MIWFYYIVAKMWNNFTARGRYFPIHWLVCSLNTNFMRQILWDNLGCQDPHLGYFTINNNKEKITNLGLDVSQLLTNATMCSQETLTALSDMSFPPVAAHPTLSTYPLHTPLGLYHMQKGEWTRGEQKPILAPLTHNFTTGVRSPLRPGPWNMPCIIESVGHISHKTCSQCTRISRL